MSKEGVFLTLLPRMGRAQSFHGFILIPILLIMISFKEHLANFL